MTEPSLAAKLMAAHGSEPCHICGKLRTEAGSDLCSYPHARLPTEPIGDETTDGPQFWAWEEPA